MQTTHTEVQTQTPITPAAADQAAGLAQGMRTLSIDELAAVAGGATDTAEQNSQQTSLPVNRW